MEVNHSAAGSVMSSIQGMTSNILKEGILKKLAKRYQNGFIKYITIFMLVVALLSFLASYYSREIVASFHKNLSETHNTNEFLYPLGFLFKENEKARLMKSGII